MTRFPVIGTVPPMTGGEDSIDLPVENQTEFEEYLHAEGHTLERTSHVRIRPPDLLSICQKFVGQRIALIVEVEERGGENLMFSKDVEPA